MIHYSKIGTIISLVGIALTFAVMYLFPSFAYDGFINVLNTGLPIFVSMLLISLAYSTKNSFAHLVTVALLVFVFGGLYMLASAEVQYQCVEVCPPTSASLMRSFHQLVTLYITVMVITVFIPILYWLKHKKF